MSEKELGQKWDRCLADCAVKFGTGLGLGIVFSVVFFKRRTWPIVFGTGLGLGMAYSNCQNDLRSHYVLHSKVAKVCVFMDFTWCLGQISPSSLSLCGRNICLH
uniref:MICOS complex subunit MIC10 n=1 Tax=Cyprinus carpio TaxID=7962 RepID=A0A8C1Z0Q3_CYPCA